jgi:glycosyltransferase involved in cell wall biosynthesis
MSENVSILILTKNEEQDLPGCLESVKWSDDIHVFDSFSTDRTLEIAKDIGATINQRPFDDWATHQNWAVQNINFKNRWVFYIDADERVTDELRASILEAVQRKDDKVAYNIQRRDFMFDTWLKHVQVTAFYQRLFVPAHMRYERPNSVFSIPDGPVGTIKGYLDHFPFSKGISHWLTRHNKYSDVEAAIIVGNREQHTKFSISKALASKDFHERRFHQKEIFYRMPGRPVIKFFLFYVAKAGFLDGHAGFTYSVLMAIYEYMIVLKTSELERTHGNVGT